MFILATLSDWIVVLNLALRLNPSSEFEQLKLHTILASRLGFVAIYIEDGELSQFSPEQIDELTSAAVPAALVIEDKVSNPSIIRTNNPDLVRRLHQQLRAAGDDRPVIVDVPISIGRSMSEASARAALDERFSGAQHPSITGIFGRFDSAQEQVLELGRAGTEVLLVTVPNNLDFSDHLAQIKALVVGAVPTLLAQESDQ